ncbi:MAG TPA: NAD(P)H-dependent oxidoreductase [Chitinophagaceae bacterium]|nr:NAD(P)H-dependent oxidoreductase [Chitinophagaceae bacterium]
MTNDNNRKKILAIPGSTRQFSTNLSLVHAIHDLFPDQLDIKIFPGLASIPHFNPDLDTATPPPEVLEFRKQLKEADGILICTPEYAMGVPGTLKNAIDWTVSSMEFSHKPVALITASSSGQKAHYSLLETLKVIESEIPDDSQLLISFVKTKVKGDKIVDDNTLEQVRKLIASLIKTIDERKDKDRSGL